MLTINFNNNEKIILLIIILIFYKINFGQKFFKKKIKNMLDNNYTDSTTEQFIANPQSFIYNYDDYDNNNIIINNDNNITNTTPTFNFPKFGYYLNKTKVPKGVYLNPYYEDELKFYKYFLSLKKMPRMRNSSLIIKERKDIFENISANIGMNITSLEEIYFNTENRFGNELIILNKLIFYCEILGVKKIILNQDNNLYINNTIYDKDYNLTIEVQNYSQYNYENLNFNFATLDNPMLNFNPTYVVSNIFRDFFFIFYNLRVENRLDIVKSEILKNLPKVKVDPKELYIHIRGGDIFKNQALNPGYATSYAQFPLCFYTRVIEKFKFKKIIIISEDRLNPIVNRLLRKYPNITCHNNNTLEKDISYLAHAYNIIGSISSFITSIIKLNDNLRYFWEYDIYQMEHKLYHFHHSLYDFPRNYTIFRMEPSEQYQKKMYIWARNESQIKIMLNDTCPNNFKIIFPNKKNNN